MTSGTPARAAASLPRMPALEEWVWTICGRMRLKRRTSWNSARRSLPGRISRPRAGTTTSRLGGGQAALQHAARAAEQVGVKALRVEVLDRVEGVELGAAELELGDQVDDDDAVAAHGRPRLAAVSRAMRMSSAMEP